ncbi:MAG: toxin-antitoxin system YwqK family antitoxin [Bacteroidota bacterium]
MRKGISLLVLALIMGLSACTFKNTKEEDKKSVTEGEIPTPSTSVSELRVVLKEETDFQGHLESYSVIVQTETKHGKYKRTDDQGVLLEEADYEHGALNGNRILYYPSRDTQILETHANGIYEGLYRSYYEGNQVKLEGYYIDNIMTGLWYKYYEDGSIKEEVTFEDNAANGPFKEFHPNGQLAVTGSYLDGENEHGELKFYAEDGVHTRTMECDRGMCRTVWRLENL